MSTLGSRTDKAAARSESGFRDADRPENAHMAAWSAPRRGASILIVSASVTNVHLVHSHSWTASARWDRPNTARLPPAPPQLCRRMQRVATALALASRNGQPDGRQSPCAFHVHQLQQNHTLSRPGLSPPAHAWAHSVIMTFKCLRRIAQLTRFFGTTWRGTGTGLAEHIPSPTALRGFWLG